MYVIQLDDYEVTDISYRDHGMYDGACLICGSVFPYINFSGEHDCENYKLQKIKLLSSHKFKYIQSYSVIECIECNYKIQYDAITINHRDIKKNSIIVNPFYLYQLQNCSEALMKMALK